MCSNTYTSSCPICFPTKNILCHCSSHGRLHQLLPDAPPALIFVHDHIEDISPTVIIMGNSRGLNSSS